MVPRETSDRPAPAKVRLRILQTTDLHGRVRGYDYCADRADRRGGLSRVASAIAEARAEVPAALLLDNGDALFGDPLGDLWAETPANTAQHPVIAAMNALGYDAMGLGNHEFNFGLDRLRDALSGAAFPVLSTNARRLDGGPELWRPSLMLERLLPDDSGGSHALRIAVLSVMPPQTLIWDARHLSGRVAICGMVEGLRAAIPAAKAQGADVVVVLNHSGLGDGSAASRHENAGRAIARLPGVDAVICGHLHLAFPGPRHPDAPDVDARHGRLSGRAAVMAGANGSHLGVLDLVLEREGHDWRVTDGRAEARPVAGMPQSRTVLRRTDPCHRTTRAAMERPVGQLPRQITSHWDLVGRPSASALVAAAQRWCITAALRDRPEERLPLLSAASPFRSGGRGGPGDFVDLPPGPLRLRDLHALYGYPNDLRAVLATGAQLRAWLEHVAAQFNRLVPGQAGQDLLPEHTAGYNIDTLFGLSYRFDLSRPAMGPGGEGRVTLLRWQGRDVAPDQRFVVALNGYRADGGGGFAVLPPVPGLTLARTVRDAIRAYVAARLPDGIGLAADWGLAPLPAATVLLQTAPGARPPEGLALRSRGRCAQGFQLFEWDLQAP